jgi:hypothetical protein
MLSVGRELNISNKRVVCRTCSWEGAGAELPAGLVQIDSAPIYFYVYRCPECGSFELARKGKLLQFRPRNAVAQADEEEHLYGRPSLGAPLPFKEGHK